MLDHNLKAEKVETKIYPPLPEDIYQVQLLDILSRENETYDSRMGETQGKEYETVLSFQFTLLEGEDDGESLRVRNVWDNFVPAKLYIGRSGKNSLYRIVEALLGRELTPQEEAEGLNGAFLNKLIGKQCRIGTKHNVSKKDSSKVFDNIETYYTSKKDLTSLTDEEKEEARVKVNDDKTE